MKHKKIILLLLFLPAISFAMMRADFPNSKSLQPMPSGITPNISGNVNNNGSNAVQSSDMQEGQSVGSESSQKIIGAPTLAETNYLWPIGIFLAVILFLSVAWLWIKKKIF